MADEIPLLPAPQPSSPEDRTRRLIVWLVFIQFNLFIFAALTLTMVMRHQFSPAGENLLMIIVTGEVGLMGTASGYFLGAGSRQGNGGGNNQKPPVQ
jgi:hypothetical protein